MSRPDPSPDRCECGREHQYELDDSGYAVRDRCWDPCVTCDGQAEHACGDVNCDNRSCSAHYDYDMGLCKRCSDGPSEPDYDGASASEIAERQDRTQRECK